MLSEYQGVINIFLFRNIQGHFGMFIICFQDCTFIYVPCRKTSLLLKSQKCTSSKQQIAPHILLFNLFSVAVTLAFDLKIHRVLPLPYFLQIYTDLSISLLNQQRNLINGKPIPPSPPKKSLCIATANFKINLFNPKSSSLPSSLYILHLHMFLFN